MVASSFTTLLRNASSLYELSLDDPSIAFEHHMAMRTKMSLPLTVHYHHKNDGAKPGYRVFQADGRWADK